MHNSVTGLGVLPKLVWWRGWKNLSNMSSALITWSVSTNCASVVPAWAQTFIIRLPLLMPQKILWMSLRQTATLTCFEDCKWGMTIYNSSEMEAISLKGTFGLGSADFSWCLDVRLLICLELSMEMGVSGRLLLYKWQAPTQGIHSWLSHMALKSKDLSQKGWHSLNFSSTQSTLVIK